MHFGGGYNFCKKGIVTTVGMGVHKTTGFGGLYTAWTELYHPLWIGKVYFTIRFYLKRVWFSRIECLG